LLFLGEALTDEQIRILAHIFKCLEDELVDPDETVADNLPSFINPMVSHLYYRIKKSHGIVCQYYTKAQLTSESFRNRYGQANRILAEMTSGDDIYATETIDRTLKLITNCFGTQNALSDMWNKFSACDSSALLKLIAESENYTQEQRLLLLFFYVHIIFYAIFLYDALASIFSHSIERKSKNFNIYKNRTIRNEILHLTLKKLILYSNIGLPEINTDPAMNMKQHLVDSILLMLSACKKSGEVLTSDYRNSLCLDDSEFDVILTHLETTFENLEIETIVYTSFLYKYSPFNLIVEKIQNEYKSKIEERKIEQEKTKQMALGLRLIVTSSINTHKP
jgi:hypothetical protein